MRRAPRFVRNAALGLGWALCSTASAQTERTEAPRGAPAAADAARNADAPAPDYAGALRTDVQLHAWFNAARTRALLRVGDYTSRLYPAWKVVLADLDGDGANEVVLGAWSWTRRHDEPD